MSEEQIFNAMVAFFEEDNWEFQWLKDTPVLSMGFSGRNGKWQCYAQARELQQQFVFYSVCPLNVPEDRLQIVAEFLTRANYGMIIGNFEMDFEDGEIRYKTSIDVDGTELVSALIRQMVYANVVVMDHYIGGIMRVIYGGATPTEAILEIESMSDLIDNVDGSGVYEMSDDDDEDYDEDDYLDYDDFGDFIDDILDDYEQSDDMLDDYDNLDDDDEPFDDEDDANHTNGSGPDAPPL